MAIEVDYPPGYDPIQANYVTAHDQAVGGLIALGAFAAISIVVALYVTPAVIATSFTVNGQVYFGVTSYEAAVELDAAWAAIDAALAAGETAPEWAGTIIQAAGIGGDGSEMFLGGVGSLIALSGYNASNTPSSPYIDHYMDHNYGIIPVSGGWWYFDREAGLWGEWIFFRE